MKVCLIDTETRFGDPPFSLACLAAYLREKVPSIEIKIIEKKSEEIILRELKEFAPDVVGLTSVSEIYFLVKDLAKKIKKLLPKSILVIGGVHITVSPKSFSDSPFDFAVIGEGEVTFVELIDSIANKLKKLNEIKGLLFRRNKKVVFTGNREFADLSKFPLPAFDLLDMDYYLAPKMSKTGLEKKLGMITSRGCPYNCSFCCSANIWKRKVRFHTAEYVVELVKKYVNEFKVSIVNIYDDLFSLDTERLKDIIKLMKKEGLLGKITFEIQERTTNLTEERAKLLKELGVTALAFGIESASPKILKLLKGGNISVEAHKKGISIAQKYGFEICCNFIIGSPHETKQDLQMTYDFIKEMNLDDVIFFPATPFPGTGMWDYAVKNKIINKSFYEKKHPFFKWGYELPLDTLNMKLILSKDINKEDFLFMARKMRELIGKGKKKLPYKYLFRFKTLRYLFNLQTIKKAWRYRRVILKRI